MLLRLVIVLALLVAGCSDAPADKLREARQDRAQADGAPGIAPSPMTAGFSNNFSWRATKPALGPDSVRGIQLMPTRQYKHVRQTESIPAVYVPGAKQSQLNTGETAPAYPTWRQGMKPLTWYEVGANVVTDVNPANDPTINPNYPGYAPWTPKGPLSHMTEEWSGGAWDETNQTFWIFGGGHEGYMGNEGYSINLDAHAPTWQRRGYPTGSIQKPGYVAGTYGDPLGRNANGWGSDGRPVAVHTYNQLAILGNGRVFFAYGNGAYDSRPAGPSAFEFDPVTNDYDMSRLYTAAPPGYDYFPPFGSAVYDSTRNIVWVTAGPRIVIYDIAARTGAIVYGNLYGPEFSGRLIRIPEHELLVSVGNGANNAASGKSVAIIDPANPRAAPVGITAASNPVWYRYGVAYDTRRKRLMGWPGGAAIETLTPPATSPKTGTWIYGRLTTSTAVTTPTARNLNGTYGRFFYNAKYDCAVAYNKTTEKLFVLPLS